MKFRRTHRRPRGSEETDLDMVPIMNMFLVLIPFLLMSASFIHLKVVNTSVPVLGNGKASINQESTIKLTVVATLAKNQIDLSVLSEELEPVALSKWERVIHISGNPQEAYDALSSHLRSIKEAYPKSDTLILVPDSTVIFEKIIQTMDVARASENGPLFPNVVLSGKVG